MSKYEPLSAHLKAQIFKEVPMRFSEIERVLDAKLPRSAYVHRPWWANEARGHVHAKAWLDAGYETAQVDMAGKKLVFRRTAAPEPVPSGVEEPMRNFAHEKLPLPLKNGTHPAIGSMKGMITIAPGVDLSEPALSEEEWDEMMAAWEKNWDALGFKAPK